MLYPDIYTPTVAPKNKLEEDLYSCNSSDDACIIAYVSKMFAVPVSELPENKKRPLTADEMRARAREAKEARLRVEKNGETVVSTETSAPEEEEYKPEDASTEPTDLVEADETLLGFARLYSGTLRVGSTVVAILPKYNNAYPPDHLRNKSHIVRVAVESLYTMMGRELVSVQFVSAGNVFAIRGIEGNVWRSATLCAPRAAGVQDETSGEWILNLGGISHQVRKSFLPPNLSPLKVLCA